MTKSYIIGLPESGKSTFLGALAFTIQNSVMRSNTFKLDRIENSEYLNSLSSTWSKCEPMGRTNVGLYERCTLFLEDGEGNKVELILPDQSGEEFSAVITNRTMSEVMYNDIIECDEMFVFINPNVISKDVMINDIDPKYRGDGQEGTKLEEKSIHEQVQYVILLQDIKTIRKKRTKFKIIISAWDVYKNDKSPKDILKEKLPLVWQYVTTNQGFFDCEFWGISAQGGDLSVADVKARMLDYEDATDRIIVVTENNNEKLHDLTALLK